MIALVFSYEVREPEGFERAYGADGEWAQFFRQGPGYVGTELLRDVEIPGRYLVVDRWESAEAYNASTYPRIAASWSSRASARSASSFNQERTTLP